MAAERDSTDRYVAAYMEAHVGATFEARITGVTKFGLFVRLKESGAEGLLPARSLGAEYFRHDERRQAMIGERSGTSLRPGRHDPGQADGGRPGHRRAALRTGGRRRNRPAAVGPPSRPSRQGKPKSRFKPKKR